MEPLGTYTSHFVEVRVALISVKQIKELNYSNIVIIRDSLNVIELLRGSDTLGWEFSSMIEEARRILDLVQNMSIVHNYKEANAMADRLASDVVSLMARKEWVLGFLEHLVELATMDSEHDLDVVFWI